MDRIIAQKTTERKDFIVRTTYYKEEGGYYAETSLYSKYFPKSKRLINTTSDIDELHNNIVKAFYEMHKLKEKEYKKKVKEKKKYLEKSKELEEKLKKLTYEIEDLIR